MPTFCIALARKSPISAVAISGDGTDLGDLVVGGDLLGVLLQVLDDGVDGKIDAALEIHRVHPGGNALCAFPDDRVGEDRRGSGAVPRLIGGLRGDLAHHLCAHVLELVVEFDLLGDGHTILGNTRRAKRLVEHDIPAFRAERDSHRVGRMSTPRNILSRASTENLTSLAAM